MLARVPGLLLAAVQTRQEMAVLVVEMERCEVEVQALPARIGGAGDHDDLPVHGPAQRDLRDGDVVLRGDRAQRELLGEAVPGAERTTPR